MTAREKLLAILNSGPILAPDAMIVLCGEDAIPRMEFAVGKFREFTYWAAQNKIEDYQPPIVLTGGLHDPPHLRGAAQLEAKLFGAGVSPDRVIIDNESQNTREQAVNVVALAMDKGWRRIMLVVSPYHAFRAYLTFLKAAQEAGIEKSLEINITPASHVPWWKAPVGAESTRFQLLEHEFTKIRKYSDHIATWQEGLKALEYWERREEGRK